MARKNFWFFVGVVAAVAISVLAFTRPARAQDQPSDIAGLKLWLKADAGVSQAGLGVSQWLDQSGHGNNAAAAQFGGPEFVDSEPSANNKPTLYFDGSLNVFNIDTRVLADNQEEFTVFGVGRPDEDDVGSIFSMRSGDDALIQLDQQGGPPGATETGRSRFIVRNSDGQGLNSLGEVGTGYGIYTGTLTAAGTNRTAQVYYNGTPGETVDADFGGNTTFTSGVQQVGGVLVPPAYQLYWEGDIAEIIVYDRALDDADLSTVGVYLEDKYGLDTAWPLAPPPPPPTTQAWNVDGSQNWDSPSNWNNRVVPNKSAAPDQEDQTVVFTNVITEPRVVFTEKQVIVKSINFIHSVSYTIAGASGSGVSLQSDIGNASLNATQGDHQFQAVVNLNSNTDADITIGASLSFNNALNLNGNTLAKTGDGTLNINNRLTNGGGQVTGIAGTISGSGFIGGDLDNQSATVAPGNSPGMLTVDGNYNQGSDGTLAIEIGGTEAGVGHDVLNVLGDASLAGTLSVSLIDGFTPSGGNTFKVLTAGGELTNSGLTLGGPDKDLFTMNIDATSDWIMLTTAGGGGGVPGDYSGNGVVDAADYTIYRDNLGGDSAALGGNGSGAATVVQADYDLWKQNFGSSGTGSTAAVPEPCSYVLITLGLLALAACRERQKPQ